MRAFIDSLKKTRAFGLGRISGMILFAFLFLFAGGDRAMAQFLGEIKQAPLKIESPAFSNGTDIPARYTVQGDDISPPLSWSNVPSSAASLVLIVDDPDAPDPASPTRDWIHWVLYNIPASVKELPAGVKELPPGTQEGLNDWMQKGYRGPHPPIGRHRYFFRLYALDDKLHFSKVPTKAEVEKEMFSHILSKASFMGTYQLQE